MIKLSRFFDLSTLQNNVHSIYPTKLMKTIQRRHSRINPRWSRSRLERRTINFEILIFPIKLISTAWDMLLTLGRRDFSKFRREARSMAVDGRGWIRKRRNSRVVSEVNGARRKRGFRPIRFYMADCGVENVIVEIRLFVPLTNET